MINIIRTTADNPDFKILIELLNSELRERYIDQEIKFAPHNLLDKNVKIVIIICRKYSNCLRCISGKCGK